MRSYMCAPVYVCIRAPVSLIYDGEPERVCVFEFAFAYARYESCVLSTSVGLVSVLSTHRLELVACM